MSVLDDWPLPQVEPFSGETLLADGWQYRDLPRMTQDAFDCLLDIIGEGNVRWLSFARYGSTVRGQCFISPAGIENMRAHREAASPSTYSDEDGR